MTETGAARLRALPSRLLRLTALYADKLSSERLAAEGDRKWGYAALASLAEGGPTSQAALSDRTGIYRSDLVAVLNDLTGRGLVERAPDPADHRRNVITITPLGRRHLRRLDKVIAAIQDELLAPLTPPERDQLTLLLTRVLRHHERLGPHPRGGGLPPVSPDPGPTAFV
jgi:DNA-binding MarR family transcriptional regulator